MNKGGYPSAHHLGLDLAHRDSIYAKISSFKEGTIFRREDLNLSEEEAEEFQSLRGIDYLHLVDGYLVGIIETADLRRAPRIQNFLSSYKEVFSADIRETGDRTAWVKRIKTWEPLKGYRYYTTGSSVMMKMGRMNIQFINAPEWLFDEEKLSPTTLAFLDTFAEKESLREATEWSKTHADWANDLSHAIEQISTLKEEQTPSPNEGDETDTEIEEPEFFFAYEDCLSYLRDFLKQGRKS